ncbi:MAG: GNAT family N-acetyltransferase [Anaerolineae bacterium]
MTESRYALAPYRQHRPDIGPLTDLTRRSFAEYPGVIVADRPFTAWFLARPGFDADASFAAWHGDSPVGSVFLTRVPMTLAGAWVEVGIVDTVMVAPDYRGQGLARALMNHAIAACRAAGLPAMQLYTAPGSAGYDLYRKLGFEEWRRLRYWHRPEGLGGAVEGGWRIVDRDGLPAAVSLLRSLSASHDGVPALDEAAQRWRWTQRPETMPATAWLREVNARPQTATTTVVNLTDGRSVQLLKDVVAGPADSLAGLCRGLGSLPVVSLADEGDSCLTEALAAAGFRPGQSEAAMLLPLGDSAAGMESHSRPWFPLAESVIGA